MKIVSASPHLHSSRSTQRIMLDVIIAMLPAFAFSIYSFGIDALILTLVSVVSCVVFEWVITKYMLGRKNTVCDLSAVVTGMLLGFNLSADLDLWMVVIGALVAIGVGKMSFGGIGCNPFNPALVGRVFLLISFPAPMTAFSYDGVSGATPLGLLKEQGVSALPELQDMLLGTHGGSLGEVGGLLLLASGIYLIVRKVISWHIPVIVLGSMAIFAEVMHLIDPAAAADAAFHLLAGGAMLGAFFMATDYSSSPMSKKGVIIYSVGIGLITMFIRTWGAYPEGMSFAILIMNATVPLLNIYCKPRRFGKKTQK